MLLRLFNDDTPLEPMRIKSEQQDTSSDQGAASSAEATPAADGDSAHVGAADEPVEQTAVEVTDATAADGHLDEVEVEMDVEAVVVGG